MTELNEIVIIKTIKCFENFTLVYQKYQLLLNYFIKKILLDRQHTKLTQNEFFNEFIREYKSP